MKRAMLFIIAVSVPFLCAIAPILRGASSRASGLGYQGPTSPVQPGQELKSLFLSQNSVIGGTSLTGRVVLKFLAPKVSGTRVALHVTPDSILPEDLESPKVQLPSHVDVPSGKTDAKFSITTFPVLSERHITVEASAGGVTRTASFTIEPLQVVSLVIVPPAGLGPFEAQGTVGLNAAAPLDTSVNLTSSNPEIVRFGTLGSAQASSTLVFHQNDSSKRFSLVASAVPQTITITISAKLNGSTVSRALAVRH